jgi:hypothetical protein
MKTPHLLNPVLTVTLMAVLLTGCDKLEKADDITFNAEFVIPQKIEVSESQDEPVNPYTSLSSSIDATQNADYAKYKDRVKKIRVNKIKYTISDFDAEGAVTLTSGLAIFFENGGTAASGEIASVSNLILSNTSGELTATQDALDTIGEILLENGQINVVSVATLSDAPVFFHITVTLDVSITANALD